MAGMMASSLTAEPTPEQLVAELTLLLDLEPRGGDRFIGRRQLDWGGGVYGGQAIAQALGAARRTVPPERHAHSLHAYFLRSGSSDLPIEFRVKRDFDGRSFSNRRVVASQRGEAILILSASFQAQQQGLSHQHSAMPDVPPPEDLVADRVATRALAATLPDGPTRRALLGPHHIDVRSVEPRDWLDPQKRVPLSHVWFRTVAALPDDEPVHRAVLAFASDVQLLSTALQPHGLSMRRGDAKAASLDHAVWFHGHFRADDWLLYVMESPWSGLARGYARGQIFTRDGRLIASVAQEGMVRPITGD